MVNQLWSAASQKHHPPVGAVMRPDRSEVTSCFLLMLWIVWGWPDWPVLPKQSLPPKDSSSVSTKRVRQEMNWSDEHSSYDPDILSTRYPWLQRRRRGVVIPEWTPALPPASNQTSILVSWPMSVIFEGVINWIYNIINIISYYYNSWAFTWYSYACPAHVQRLKSMSVWRSSVMVCSTCGWERERWAHPWMRAQFTTGWLKGALKEAWHLPTLPQHCPKFFNPLLLRPDLQIELPPPTCVSCVVCPNFKADHANKG